MFKKFQFFIDFIFIMVKYKKEKALEHKPEKSDTQTFVLGIVTIMDKLLKEIYRGTFDK